ncbi:hypothetical protein ABID22_000915 [Pontibacter aydingkolensis]|uniref:Uncharacterized protein n=1 Tax=Pontibacter aydingkolensis TaxID=1911536 RepID=A0ABS7CSL3_9BACT|nr:hypothetical protein [Pontibacter aydingkolensis]MBW7466833.1 hypothetical protein [Pontibacter aydingkolensis]
MKILTQKPKQKTQRKTSKNTPVKPKGQVSAANAVELESEEQLSAYDSYYQQLSEEVESIERHVCELRQTPGLEHLTEAEAHAKVDFMLRFSAWVFNQHLQDQDFGTIEHESIKAVKVQNSKGQSNKKVTQSLSY